MKHVLAPSCLALALICLTGTANAACFADYKAKRDGPLRLHYGVVELSDAACRNRDRATAEAARRLAAGDWTLLTVLSTFGPEGLKEREQNAGRFFLRY